MQAARILPGTRRRPYLSLLHVHVRAGIATAGPTLSGVRLCLALLLLCCSAAFARAEHGDPGYRAWPDESRPLPTNGRVGLLAFNGPHPFVIDVITMQPRLVATAAAGAGAASARIAVTQVAAFKGYDWGGYGDAGVLFAPTRTLDPRTEYSLCLDVEARELCPATWTTGDGPDRQAPTWRGPPRTRKPSLDAYARAFQLPAHEDHALMIEVVARSPGLSTQTVWLSGLSPGDAGCVSLILDVDGDPSYDRIGGAARTFTLRFTGFDAAGHRLRTRGRFKVRLAPEENVEVCLAAPAVAPAPEPPFTGDGE